VTYRTERLILALILLLFLVLGAGYSIVVPPFEASDELWHYPMVKYVADHWTLPVQVPGIETPWRQEGSQPPLYYGLTAAATFWIDTSDMESVRHLNRHVDNGVATPDGNINLVVHRPGRESFPWRGTVLAIHMARFVSVLMGTAAVYLTYLIVREVLPEQPALVLGTAAIHAFTPMYVFISGAVNNDNLSVPLSNLALLMQLRLLKQQSWTTRQGLVRYLALGGVLGLAALTKLGWPALAVLTALVVTVRAVRLRSWSEFFMGGLATVLPLLIIGGWWYVRNLRLYGDLLGLAVFKVILGTREVPADLAQLWRERYSFTAGYWGNFGGLNVPMSGWAYAVLNTVALVAALGLVILLLRSIVVSEKRLIVEPWALAVVVLWGLGVFLPWALSWARDTWSSQGRLVFSAIATWSLLMVLGLAGWFPRRWAGWVVAVFALLLLGLSVVSPIVTIKPAYALPEPLTDTHVAAIPHRVGVDFVDFRSATVMRLLGYDLGTQSVEPGGQVEVTLYWQALAPTDRDYTVFVHLLGEGELVVAQRDTLPGLGRLSTMWLEPGVRWADRYVLEVPHTAYTPDTAIIQVGLYDPVTGVRLPAVQGGGGAAGDSVRFGPVSIGAPPSEVPNPISVNFGDRMALVGYDLNQRVLRPGETVTLTLHWHCLQQMDTNYNISAQVVDTSQRKAAQHDGWPLDGAAPTAAWEPGQSLTDTYTLQIYPDANLGVYDVRIIVYALKDGEIRHLPVTPEGGRMQAKHITLTTLRVVR
jgi:hypothetical protein